jgi:hypothetical protein
VNVQKPIGGKSYMICLGPIPEDKYMQLRKEAKKNDMRVEEYCLWLVQKAQGNKDGTG